jgi:quinol monooxygenase YgiN
MPASPWRVFSSPDPNSDVVALLSYLPLKSYWRIFLLLFYLSQTVKQLAQSNGLLGYALLAHPFSKRFFTLSAWENDAALRSFVQHPPHLHIMAALAPHMAKTHFVRWTVKASALPLQWDDALRRFHSDPSRPGA